MNRTSSVFVAGHRGLVGNAICRKLEAEGFQNIIKRTHAELDLRNKQAVENFFYSEKPEYVYLAAAKVGGIHANDSTPADFIRDNLLIQTNVIDAAHRHGTKKLLFLGSSCIYPKLAAQPITENALLTGALEPTNEGYAIAKIAGIKMCQAYRKQYGFNAISAMPTNLYGPCDNFDLMSSHVLPALLRKFHEAKVNGQQEVVVWGSGKVLREFLHVEDLADACVFLMWHYDSPGIINIGSGREVSIGELAEMIKRIVGFEGLITFDITQPDGTPRKLLDLSKIRALGWEPRISLEDGLVETYRWFCNNINTAKGVTTFRQPN